MSNQSVKYCSRCGGVKPLDQFNITYYPKTKENKRSKFCADCDNPKTRDEYTDGLKKRIEINSLTSVFIWVKRTEEKLGISAIDRYRHFSSLAKRNAQ